MVPESASVVPGVGLQEELGDDEELPGEPNFIAQDRSDMRFAFEELRRDMACASWQQLQKLAWYRRLQWGGMCSNEEHEPWSVTFAGQHGARRKELVL